MGRANGSRERAPDDRLRETHHPFTAIEVASSAVCNLKLKIGRRRHCEERSDAAIHSSFCAAPWIASLRSQ
jgi:hypothetical protein